MLTTETRLEADSRFKPCLRVSVVSSLPDDLALTRAGVRPRSGKPFRPGAFDKARGRRALSSPNFRKGAAAHLGRDGGRAERAGGGRARGLHGAAARQPRLPLP